MWNFSCFWIILYDVLLQSSVLREYAALKSHGSDLCQLFIAKYVFFVVTIRINVKIHQKQNVAGPKHLMQIRYKNNALSFLFAVSVTGDKRIVISFSTCHFSWLSIVIRMSHSSILYILKRKKKTVAFGYLLLRWAWTREIIDWSHGITVVLPHNFDYFLSGAALPNFVPRLLYYSSQGSIFFLGVTLNLYVFIFRCTKNGTLRHVLEFDGAAQCHQFQLFLRRLSCNLKMEVRSTAGCSSSCSICWYCTNVKLITHPLSPM